MDQKFAIIKCQKCGYISDTISETCPRCSSRLEKICPECGFSNIVEKRHCIQCSAELTLRTTGNKTAAPEQSPAKAPSNPLKLDNLEIQSIQDTVKEKGESFRDHQQHPMPAAPLKPEPAVAPNSMAEKKPGTVVITPLKPSVSSKLSSATILVGSVVALAVFGYFLVTPHIPRITLKLTAKSYLNKLAAGKYAEAYAMLSTNSRAAYSKESFVSYNEQYYSKLPTWEAKNIEIFALEPEAAMIKYQLKEGTAPWRDDYISFVNEHGKWTRPYIWMLFDPIEAAIAKQDYPQALFLAQKLYLTDPMDPRTSGYLCVSEFFMGLYDKAAESCKKTFVSGRTYPVGFTSEELFWFDFYYADSLRFSQKYDDAIAEYDALMKADTISAKEQCPLFLSRADALVRTKRYDLALSDMLKADGICVEGSNRAEVVKRMRFMNGDAKAEAIAFAKKARSRPDMPSIADARAMELKALAEKLGPKNKRYLPRDTWIAAHIAGPAYRVVLRQESLDQNTGVRNVQDIYVFVINLWTGEAKLDNTQPDPDKE